MVNCVSLNRHLLAKVRTRKPFTIIFSLSRCGSTSIYRTLNLHRACKLVYEPDFSKHNVAEFLDTHKNLRENYTGMKHVWDPSGFPFRADHRSMLKDIEKNCETWISMNEALLSSADQKIIFLTRKDEKSRIVSDLFGQATEVWGPEPNAIHSAKVDSEYQEKVTASKNITLPIDVLHWYINNIPRINSRLRDAAASNTVLDIQYEQIFSARKSIENRIDVFKNVLDFLELNSNFYNINFKKVSKILAPSGKLNSQDTYKKILNISEIKKEIGWECPLL